MPDLDNEMFLAFVVSQDTNELFVHLDKSGIDCLIRDLQRMRDNMEKGDAPHKHYFSEEWGGYDLSPATRLEGEKFGQPMNHVKIIGWSDEWMNKFDFHEK